ncbi:MAG: ABC transporter substrate-binding protein [Mycobacteriales bacterium]
MSRPWTIRAVAAGAVLALAAAACGSSSPKTSSPSTSGSQPAVNSFGLSTGATVANPSTVKGGTLNIASTTDVDSLDPARTYYAFSWDLQRLFERTLLMYDPVPGIAGTLPVPDIATSVPVGQNNNTVWTYHLKHDIKFQDGTPVTSADIKYAIERIFATSVINGGPTYVICLLTTCNAAGNSPYPGPYASSAGLSSIVTPDPYTITFHLVKPFADWNYVMTLPGSAPVPPAKDTRGNYASKPVATGPYEIQTYQPNRQIVFVRNPYWTDDAYRKALPDKIVMTEGLSANTEDSDIIANQQDVAVEGTGVQAAAQAQILANPALKARADNPITGFLRYLSIETKVAPLNNVHCRRAVEYAVNKYAWLLARGGTVSGGDIANSLLPPNLPGHTNANIYPNGTGNLSVPANNTGNLAMAKSELAACGHPNGFTTNLATTNKGKGVTTAVAVQAALARVGITANIKQVDAATYYSNYIGSPNSERTNGLGLAIAGWGPDWPAAYAYFESIVDGRAIKQAGNSNYAELNDPVVNHLLDQLTAASTTAQETQLGTAIDNQVMQDAAIVPMNYDKALNIFSSRLTNVYINQAFGIVDFVSLGVGG